MFKGQQLKWQSPKHLLTLATKFEKSVNISMKNMDPEKPEKTLMATPAYITDDIFDDALRYLKNPYNREPIVIVDIDADKVEISFITTTGHRMNHAKVTDIRKLTEIKNHDLSRGTFLAYIAQQCYKMCKAHLKSILDTKKTKLLCSIILRFKLEQTSIKDSTLSKFGKGFFIPDCEGEDLVYHFNNQLGMQQGENEFQIHCTHLLQATPQILVGLCMNSFDEDRRPDILIAVDHGVGIYFFEKNHKLNEFKGKRMLMDVHYQEFGTTVGSLENNFLRRFLRTEDLEIKNCEPNHLSLSYFIGGSAICDKVLNFLKQSVPDFSTKFSWINSPKSIKEGDISDLLESVEKGKNIESTLTVAYDDLDEKTQQELYELCVKLRDRSAAMMAAVAFGIMKRVSQKSSKQYLIVGLSGRMMLDMYGYLDQFSSKLQTMSNLHAIDHPNEIFIIHCVSAQKLTLPYGVLALSKYINMVFN